MSIKNQVSSLPLRPISQCTLDLCTNCSRTTALRRANYKKVIARCRTVNDYIVALKFCKKCRTLNEDFLKNQYYKNFLLFRKEISVFSWITMLLYIVTSVHINSSIVDILWFGHIWVWKGAPRYLFFIALSSATVKFRHFLSVRIVCMALSLFRMFKSKTVVFDIPIDPYLFDGLKDLVKRLALK